MIGFAIPKLNEESISKSDLLWGRSESKTIRQVIILYIMMIFFQYSL